MKPDNPIIVALDFSELQEARKVVERIRPHIGMIKIGLELFTAYGREALEMSSDYQIPVFLDLKLYDVPTTVSKTTAVVCSLLAKHPGEHFLSVHCLGGKNMCKVALESSMGSNVTIAGVTVLTSHTEREFSRLGYSDRRPGIRTVDAADIAYDCMNDQAQYDPAGKRVYSGLKHFICAPNQIPLMKQHYEDSVLITPGIRAEGDDTNDHARTKPAGFALKSGASWIVVGRPITKATDPRDAAFYFEQQAKKYG
jgi:orotidine-5'-phosphate decarboxylase